MLIEQLHEKRQLVVSLKKQNFIYCNAVDRHVSVRDNDHTLVRKLTRNNRQNRVFCTNDRLNKKYPEKCTEQRRLLAQEHKVNPDLDIVYADFTYCNFELGAMTTSAPSKPKKNEKISVKKSSGKRQPSDEASLPKNDVINILLLGETGVGKSTFINAFVNYLTSETFDRAQSNEPVVLIPVSFLLTTGDNFDEHTVKFGDFVTSHNEDFDHPGESVTQHCKSYEFHLNRGDGKKLCIIDTPGFGDTRGLDQDDLNMQDILEYINNLTHLNAVCFLLKPNSSELHTFFRMCFMQLIDLLGPDVRENIIFCFTNARSTFYVPGDTARVLKAMLKSLSMSDIPFKKENTFCFDNEAFRYLVALQNSISFNELDRNEYERSWSISVTESNRLVDYISNQLNACPMHNEWQSIKRAQVTICDMIRPMLEAVRNLLRNIILCKMETPNKCIKLCPKAIHRPATICPLCTPYPINMGKFWIVREITHEILKKCLVCSCAADQHISINYLVHFEYLDSPPSYPPDEMTVMVEKLCRAGAKFDYFLKHSAGSSKDDPFSNGLIRIIAEEDSLCKNQKPNRLNLQLLNHLNKLKRQYKERIADLKSTQSDTSLSNIHELISTIRAYPTIPEQLDAIKETQKMMAEQYEVPPN
jgi:hypothetical protein